MVRGDTQDWCSTYCHQFAPKYELRRLQQPILVGPRPLLSVVGVLFALPVRLLRLRQSECRRDLPEKHFDLEVISCTVGPRALDHEGPSLAAWEDAYPLEAD